MATILVVDDNGGNRKLVVKPLSFADMTTWLGRSRGEQAAVRRTS
jgi:hypothetical protein